MIFVASGQLFQLTKQWQSQKLEQAMGAKWLKYNTGACKWTWFYTKFTYYFPFQVSVTNWIDLGTKNTRLGVGVKNT